MKIDEEISAVEAKKISEKLVSLRQERNMSRKDFGKLFGIDYVSVHQWENGRNIKGIVRFFEICRKLNVKPNYFFDD